MTAFVVGTGRCGTHTLVEALKHATNYRVLHEQAAQNGQLDPLCYAENDIAIGWPLVMFIPQLRVRYPEAKWVHLIRADRAACVRSLAAKKSAMEAFTALWAFNSVLGAQSPEAVAGAWYDSMFGLCEALIPPGSFRLTLESAALQWPACWEWLGCRGDFAASLAEWADRQDATLWSDSQLPMKLKESVA